ncbi:RNA helicase [Trypanosoma theileri]|uniref:RNA helicase n=1 Tax=Trypanosoma theileri TaxID=67003 RepID=A0A1X0P787_9TRYP|nr:RNA helicase [Trypanosoma theileri]ORC92290.1 RNA helicase [Trypanosoma theileri]
MTQRITIPDDCVYEGYGTLYHDDAEIPPLTTSSLPPPLLPQSAASHEKNDAVLQFSINREEALRQLRAKLHVDTPPQLVVTGIPQQVLEDTTLLTSKQSHRLVYPQDAPLLNSPPLASSGTWYEIDRMKSQCRFLRDWMMCHESTEEKVKAKEFVRATLQFLNRDTVKELLFRTEGLLQQLENWPAVVNAARPQIPEWNDETTLAELHEFVKNIWQMDEVCDRLRELTGRFYLISPLVEETAFELAAMQEIEQWSSEGTLSSLQSLQKSIEKWGTQLKEDQHNIQNSTQMLLERINTVKKKKGISSV